MRNLSLLLLLVIALAPVAFADGPSLAVQVGETSVRVSNLTPGGDAVLFSYAKFGSHGGTTSAARPRLLHDDDGDGVVTLAEPVPYVSVWVAVDWKTGATATGAREGFPLYVRPLAPALFRKDADEQISALEKRIPRLMLLLVRPGQGAWTLRAREGGPGDRDKEANGHLVLAFEDAQPLEEGKEKAPKHLKAGDVVVAIDLGHLDLFVGEVGK
jgi:hypothetical protein